MTLYAEVAVLADRIVAGDLTHGVQGALPQALQ